MCRRVSGPHLLVAAADRCSTAMAPSWRGPATLGSLLLATQCACGFLVRLPATTPASAAPQLYHRQGFTRRWTAGGPSTEVAPEGTTTTTFTVPPLSDTASTQAGVTSSSQGPYYPATDRVRNGRPTMIFVEEIDFCLQRSSSGSGSCSQLSEALNTLSNHFAKKILIGVDYCFGEMVEDRKAQLRSQYGDTPDIGAACDYVDAVAALSPCLPSDAEVTRSRLQDPYKKAYDKLFETLMSHGCEFREGAGLSGGNGAKMVAKDQDICLSLLDTLSSQPTKTKVLNTLSNRVARTLLYGGEEDAAKLGLEMEAGQEAFLSDWVGEQRDCDEALYYSSLVHLLRDGLDTPTPAFHGSYANAYQRLVTLLVKELGSQSAPVNGELFDQFIRWESALRKNLTLDMWDAHPRELAGEWRLFDEGQTRPLRLIFRRDGSIKVPPELGMGGSWRLEPGPTHLDTIIFDVATGSPDQRVLSYTGYVDRGQRIETRFSKRPIKVQGRMVLKIRGEGRMSSKFSAEHPTSKPRRGALSSVPMLLNEEL